MAVKCTAILLLTFGLCEATYKICPAISINSTHRAFGTTNYVQQGVWQELPCKPFRFYEALYRVIWFKQESSTTPELTLITHKRNKDYPESDRYAFGTSGFSLVIKGVQESDEGSYLCQVIPRDTTDRTGEVNIQVIGDTFPGSSSQASSTASFHRGRRQTVPCECASQTQDVVYWSTGEGVTTETQIIGARFSDGTTLQIQHGAEYSIGSNASLTVNSLNDVQDTQRFWCHVFQSDGTLRNCDIDAQISDDVESASDALKASERSFYLRSDTQQMLPCLSWTPGDTACEVEWSKLDNPDREILSYNLSSGVVDSSPEFDLASDFGLVLQSVDDDHAGVYRCAVGDEIQIDVEVRVIGDRFPFDGGSATGGDSVTFKPKTRLSLQCPALLYISLTNTATLFWSFGAPDVESTTVIGTLNLPDGPIKMSDLGKDCLGISMEGTLLLNNCSQNDDVRYWCHIFHADGDLIRSFVDVFLEDSNDIHETFNIVVIVVCVPLFVALLGLVLILMRKRRRRSSHSREDRERGGYKPLDKREFVPELDMKKLAKTITAFVISKFGRIPITPWVDGDNACFTPIETVYRPLEMFANVSHGGITVKYRLDSESCIFDDGIPELASKHVILQGRRGCGKTTFLYRLIFDWAMGRERALWGIDQIVVLVPAWLLIKAKTIGEVVVECMLPKDANISAKSINAHYTQNQNNLIMLIDDCNDQDDIDAVMKVMTDHGFLGCQLVLISRNAELAKAASQNHNLRHVTITGFTLRNAIEYINAVLDAAEDREKATPKHNVVKSEAAPKTGSTTDTTIEQHLAATEQSPKVSTCQETKVSSTTDENLEKIEESKTIHKKKRTLQRYLEQYTLQPEISCFPAVLVALCQLSIWTKGDAFKSDVTVANLLFRLVKIMFERKKGQEVGVIEGNQLCLFLEDQVNVLAELGRVAYSRLVDSCSNYADYCKEEFLSSSEKGEHVLEIAKEVGLLCPLQVESKVKSMKHSTETVSSEVPEVEIRTGFCCCERRQQNRTKRDPTREDTELIHLTSPKVERVYFVLEIVEQLCVAVFFAQTTGNVRKMFENTTKIGHREILQRFSNVFQFAIQDNQFDREALVDYCAKILNRGHSQVGTLHVVLQLQKFVELCLQLNLEGQCEGALNKKLKSIFPDGRVRFLGISSYKLRLLSYLIEHAQSEVKGNLNVKSVEMLRIGRYDWPELQKYIEYFISGKKGFEKKTNVKTKTKCSQPVTTVIHQGTVTASQEHTQKLPKHPLVNHLPESEEDNDAQEAVKYRKTEPQPDSGDQPKFVQPKVVASSTEDDVNEDETTDASVDENIASFDVIDSKKDLAVPKKLRERIESSNQDMPHFPSDESDISVLHTVQSFGLQELLESQAGECYSSGAARDFARCLPRLEMLESLVLVGTILSSDAICDLAKRAQQLPKLKKLDLRLNKQFDDRAFVAVINLLLRQCKKLTDLRLSLYKVKGFDEVQKNMTGGKFAWGRLKTLYLLHGSNAERFVGFLSNNVKYFHYVECLHFSATVKSEEIHDNIQGEFDQNMTNPNIMPHLEDLEIGNMETLKTRLASLKLPKKKKGSVISNVFGKTVTDPGNKTTSGIAHSVADTLGGATGIVAGVEVYA